MKTLTDKLERITATDIVELSVFTEALTGLLFRSSWPITKFFQTINVIVAIVYFSIRIIEKRKENDQ